MLERELREMGHIPRWCIVRTIRQQYLAEHTAMVALYANDIAVYLGLFPSEIGTLLQMALWHDFKEEIISGDITGPCKRAGMDAPARKAWDGYLHHRSSQIFEDMDRRDGSANTHFEERVELLKAILKLADMLDECCEMGVEMSLGNRNVSRIFADSLQRVKAATERVAVCMGWPPVGPDIGRFRGKVVDACLRSRDGESRNTHFDSL